jgi:hypothetical protein
MSLTPLDPLPTRIGHSEWEGNRYVGHAVPDLLEEQETVAGLLTLAVCGRQLAPAERAVLDDIAVAMTNGDPRIFPHKVARLVSAYGSCAPAMAAGLLFLEGAYVGPGAFRACAELLVALRDEAPDLDPTAMQGAMERRLRAGRPLSGFNVPFRPHCERLLLVKRSIARRERDRHFYWQLMECAADAMRRLNGPEPDAGIGIAAALLDLGFTPRQISHLCIALAQPVFLATVVEGSEQKERVLRRLPDDRVRYVGAAPRVTPRAAKATGGGEASERE